MKISILTLFPEMFEGVFGSSILKKAVEKGKVEYKVTNFRDFSTHKAKQVDDYPFGGGAGMVLQAQPIFDCIDRIKTKSTSKPHIILMCPQGQKFTQKKAEELAKRDNIVFICGHYEGYDERIREHLVDEEISIGDYVLTGGELGAMVVTDAVVRLLPDVLGQADSHIEDSHSTGLLEHPHYTRPAEFRGMAVPDILMSGNHKNIMIWRRRESLKRTLERRSDMLETAVLSDIDLKVIESIKSVKALEDSGLLCNIKPDRIELKNNEDNLVGEITFPKIPRKKVVEITRVFVDESLRGQGIAGKLVQAAYDEIKLRDLNVVPICSYAQTWFERNEDRRDILKVGRK